MRVLAFKGTVEKGCVPLPADVDLPDATKVYVVVPGMELPQTAHIRSPKSVNPEDVGELVSEVHPADTNPEA
jgi:hypothetical protein